jgi:hypothetical protein
MNKMLAVGSSQLGGFKLGFEGTSYVDYFNRIDFAGMWETGFGYLNLDDKGMIVAPDIVPEQNNPGNHNLKQRWSIAGTDHALPCIHDYDRIFILASPCKFFSPLYYSTHVPVLLSPRLIQQCLASQWIDSDQFVEINPWQFRISPIIRQICMACPQKVVFVGAPLPICGQEFQFLEPLRNVLTSDQLLLGIHRKNIAAIRQICDSSGVPAGDLSFKIFLPPDDLLCDLTISTRKEYMGRNHWHASPKYWSEIIEAMVKQQLLD